MHLEGDVLSDQDIDDDIRKSLLRLPVNTLNEHIRTLQALVAIPEGFMTCPLSLVEINRNEYIFRTGVLGGKLLECSVTPDYIDRMKFNGGVVLLDYLGDFSLEVSFKLHNVLA
jgi:hypothetical protein